MNADQARALNDEYFAANQMDMEALNARIAEAARAGKTGVLLNMTVIDSGARDRVAAQVMDRLRENGFTVKRTSGSDPRDSSEWDNIHIRW